MVNYWAERIVLECMRINKPLNEIKICVNGITFHACSVKGICKSILFKHTKITVYLQKLMLFP